MTRLTDSLVRVSDRLIPSSSDQVLKLISPASFQVARHESREIALAFIWGVAAILGIALMILLSAGGKVINRQSGDDGLVVGLFLTWFAIAGVWLHGARYLAARTTKKSIERAYTRRVGWPSSKDAALGREVYEEKPGLLLALTRSTDWDLILQGVLAAAVTILMH
jgi:hypothetical protein